jgi:cytochrome P450
MTLPTGATARPAPGEIPINGTDLADLTTVFVDPTAYADDERFHAACRVLRREHPVVKVESERYRPFWALTRHADVLDVERDNEHFLNAPRALLVPAAMEERAQANGGPPLRTLIHMDDPEHKAFRGIASSWFLPGRIRMLEERIRQLAVRYISHMTDLGSSCDFAQEVAVGFPLHVILSILGLPEEDFPKMLQLTRELFDADDDEAIGSRDPAARMAILLGFFQYFMALTEDRRATPTDDLASTIANATIEGQLLNDFDAASYYVIIATAGHDTTSSSIAGGLEALLRHPDQLARWRDDPSLGATAVDEMVRWETPVKEFMRTATENRVIGGETILAGDSVYLAYLSANRDEAVFEDPFRFDVGRVNNKHVAFGQGVHFCLGAHLARLELRIFFEELLARVDDIQLAGEPQRSATVFVGGLKHLPISYQVR